VAELLQLALQLVRVELVTLDDEDGAVAVARELLVDRVQADLVAALERRRRRLAGERSMQAAHDLHEPGGARVDDAGLLQHRQHLPRLRDRVVAAGEDRREVAAVLGAVGIERIAVSIVPSTGFRTARYA